MFFSASFCLVRYMLNLMKRLTMSKSAIIILLCNYFRFSQIMCIHP